MICILSWTDNQKASKTLFSPLNLKLKKIQGLFKDLHRNLRTLKNGIQGPFEDFPNIHGLFKTVRTLYNL